MSGKKNVLIVHIDEYALIGLERTLEDRGYHTTTTWDAVEAARLLKACSFDLVVIGDRPPLVDASNLLAAARSANGDAKLVILQADNSFMTACLHQVCGREELMNCA